MRAALFHEGGRTLEVAEVPEPRPAPGEVVLQVRAAGLCGTDLKWLDGLRLPPGVRFPMVLGHEVAGEVVEVGQDAAPWRAGDRVLINPYVTCGTCHACRAGRASICVTAVIIGLQRQGGFAERLAVPAANLHRMPAGLSFDEGAVIPDAVATAYHALVRRGGLVAGQSVAIFGAGGLGTHGILLARLLGASPVIAVVRREVVAARVRAMGVDAVLVGDESNPVREIRRLTGGLGANLAVDFVGKPESVRTCVAAARIGGRAVLVGVADEPLTLMGSTYLVRYELDIRGAFAADREDIDAALALVAQGRLDLRRSVSLTFPLAEISHAVGTLRERSADIVRIVVHPHPADQLQETGAS